VYCRFGTDSFLLMSSLRSSEHYQLLMYVNSRQGQTRSLLRHGGRAQAGEHDGAQDDPDLHGFSFQALKTVLIARYSP